MVASNNGELVFLRSKIDNIDSAILSLLAERMQLVRQVGVFKKKNHLSPLDVERWGEVLAGKMEMARKLNIHPEMIYQIYTLIHEEALKIEEALQ